MLSVQNYLLNHSLNELQINHGINASIVNHKFSLNYDQIEAIEFDKMAQECRGLVLSHSHSYLGVDIVVGATTVLAHPFNRFFNLGQEAAANIDFTKPNLLKFYEKLDGTCIIFYFDHIKDAWCVATRSVPEAHININGFENYTFTTLFQKTVFDTTGMSYDTWLQKANLRKENTYIFELCTPANRIVVQYDDYRIYLTGIRSNVTDKEIEIETVNDIFVPRCITYNLGNLQDMVDFVGKRNPLEHEGIVVCDNNFKRIKVKNPEYMAYNRIKDSVANSPRALLQIVLNDKLDDLTPVLPADIIELGLSYKEKLAALIKDFNSNYTECQTYLNSLGVMSDKIKQKQFALEVQRKKMWLAPAMLIYNNKAKNIRDFFNYNKSMNGEYKKSFLDSLLEKF